MGIIKSFEGPQALSVQSSFFILIYVARPQINTIFRQA